MRDFLGAKNQFLYLTPQLTIYEEELDAQNVIFGIITYHNVFLTNSYNEMDGNMNIIRGLKNILCSRQLRT